jgi:hypothetical protein
VNALSAYREIIKYSLVMSTFLLDELKTRLVQEVEKWIRRQSSSRNSREVNEVLGGSGSLKIFENGFYAHGDIERRAKAARFLLKLKEIHSNERRQIL